MSRFADFRTEAIYKYAWNTRVPKHVARKAHRALHLLTAAYELHDVGVVGRIARLHNEANRYAVHVHEKWWITFTWDESFGAKELKVQRL